MLIVRGPLHNSSRIISVTFSRSCGQKLQGHSPSRSSRSFECERRAEEWSCWSSTTAIGEQPRWRRCDVTMLLLLLLRSSAADSGSAPFRRLFPAPFSISRQWNERRASNSPHLRISRRFCFNEEDKRVFGAPARNHATTVVTSDTKLESFFRLPFWTELLRFSK